MKKILMLVLAAFIPATASAGVMVTNKDKAKVKILIKRENTTMSDTVAPGMTIDLPGAPMKVTIEKTGVYAVANDGDTLVIEKGKFKRTTADGAEVDPAPTATPETETEPEAAE